MKKLRLFFGFIIFILLVSAIDIFLVPTLSARISTLAFVRKYDLFSPQAPIVITKREIVRAEDSNGFVDSLDAVKSRLVAVVDVSFGGASKVISSGFVATADGVVVTGVLSLKPEEFSKYRIVDDAGGIYDIQSVVTDPATSLSFVVSDMTRGAVVEFDKDAQFLAGQRMVVASHGPFKNSARAGFAYVVRNGQDFSDTLFDFDRQSGFVPVTVNSELVSGSVLVDSEGKLLAVWNGKTFLDSTTVASAIEDYAVNQNGFARGSLGFSFQVTGGLPTDSRTDTVSLLVTQVSSPQSLFKPQDVILSLNDKQIKDYMVDNIFRFRVLPNENLKFEVYRNNKTIEFVVKTAVLK